jgi:radical SAM superfamily enzyme YgiQ (UPF0313 family)
MAPDVTLVNLNLMLANGGGYYDEENYVPLGILYIAASLERAGYAAEFVDYQLFSHARLFDPDLFVEALGDTAPIIGLSCMSNLLPFAILVAERLKKKRPGCTVVLGGVGPSPVAAGILQAFPFIDIVVEGDGELAMIAIAGGDRTRLPPRAEPRNLDALPLPAYGLLDFANYIPARSLVTSRGCPYRCTFCTEPHNFGGHVRFRSVESVIEEMTWLHRLHAHATFLFQDDTLPIDRKRFARMLAALRALPFAVQWKCFSRVDLMDDELMAEMAASGCVQVRYGIESGSNQTLARIRKGFTIEQAFDVTTRSVRHFASV